MRKDLAIKIIYNYVNYLTLAIEIKYERHLPCIGLGLKRQKSKVIDVKY